MNKKNQQHNLIEEFTDFMNKKIDQMRVQALTDRDSLERTNIQLLEIQRKAYEAANFENTIDEADKAKDELVRMCLKVMTHGIPYIELEQLMQKKENKE